MVLSSKVLIDKLCNLEISLKAQVQTYTKQAVSLLKLRELLFSDDSPSRGGRNQEEPEEVSVDQSTYFDA